MSWWVIKVLIVGRALCASPCVSHSSEYDAWETTKCHLGIPESSHTWRNVQHILTWRQQCWLWRLTQNSSMVHRSLWRLAVPRENSQFGNFFLPVHRQAQDVHYSLNLLITAFNFLCSSAYPSSVCLQNSNCCQLAKRQNNYDIEIIWWRCKVKR